MRHFAMIAVLLCGGCMPIAQHGPWVRPKLSGSVGGTAAVAGDLDNDSRMQPFFSFDAGARVGFPLNDTTQHGFSIGLGLPLVAVLADAFRDYDDDWAIVQMLNVDAYGAFAAGPETNLAVGATVSRFHWMPYIQVGKLDDWYGTLGVLKINDTDTYLMAPSFTQVRRNSPGQVTHITFTAGLGTGEDDIALLAGFSLIFEFHRNNARP
jgi:hypothetical protein